MTTFYLDPESGADVTHDASSQNLPLGLTGTTLPLVDSTRTKFGTYALNLVSASNDAGAATPSVMTVAGAQFGAGQFTVEAWIYLNTHSTTASETIISLWGSSSNQGWSLDFNSSGQLQFQYSTNGSTAAAVGAAYTPATGQWLHIAADRDASNVLRVYAGGSVIASATVAAALFASTRQLYVGNNTNTNSKLPGYIGAVRITKGVARYAGAFTPPAAAFPTTSAGDSSYASTTLLLNFDTNGSGTSFANRWRTMTYGALASRLTAGDTVRIMASPDPTLVGSATWSSNSRLVTLAASVNYTIHNCETVWNAAANVTATANTSSKEGTRSANLALNGSFTTGLIGYQTLASTLPTVSARAANLLGAGTLPLLASAHADEAIVTVNLPFAVTFNGASYTTVYVSSNSFLTFGTSAQAYTSISGSNPSVPNIQICTADHAYEKVYAGSEDGNATFRIRYEGSNVYSGSAFDMIWEITFTAATPGTIKIDIGTNAAKSTGASGISSGTAYLATFDAGLENVGYTMTPAPSGTTFDLSAYQQVSFWFNNASAALAAGVLSLRLCSDNAGATTVNTIPLPAIPTTNSWVPVTVDLGAPLGSAIGSVALYADAAPGAVTFMLDNIIACKASSSPDALTHQSLIGKVNNLSWTATTAYALGTGRRPSQPNRNGFSYRVTTAGTSGATEPTWPLEIGQTVADASVVWTCQELEDGWYPIASIVGSTVRLDGPVNASPASATGYAYQGAAETVATYRREPVRVPWMVASNNSVNFFSSSKSGIDSAWITYSGGWSRADMSVQSGESWLTGGNGIGYGLYMDNGSQYVAVDHMGFTRFSYGLSNSLNALTKWTSVQAAGCSNVGMTATGRRLTGTNLVAVNCGVSGIDCTSIASVLTCVTANGIAGNNPQSGVVIGSNRSRMNYVVARGNGGSGVINSFGNRPDLEVRNLTTANNGSYGYNCGLGSAVLVSANMAEATPIAALTQFGDMYVYSQRHGAVAGVHLATTDGGTVRSVTDVRHTASGIAWRFNPTSTDRGPSYPLRLSVAKIACTANVAKTVRIWTRRDNANIRGLLTIEGGQLAGLAQTVSVACTPTLNTWEQSGALTFTALESGVVEVTFQVYDGINTTNNFWIDDLTVS